MSKYKTFKTSFCDCDNTFKTSFCDCNKFEILYGEIQEVESKEIDVYDGETTVTPSAHNEHVLFTANKRLLENVVVKEIPYYETSNQSGETIYIG